ncbi:MAG TPA: U32 family peptidase, partial [Woeseiaceae bacterium]|nr:U32 family peptidase [Woeseiaceae bacterium]
TPFVGGPSLNIYNSRTLNMLVGLGLVRWTLPVELSKNALTGIQQEVVPGVEAEAFAWGRMPIAYSARCYTAPRAQGRQRRLRKLLYRLPGRSDVIDTRQR